VTRALSDERWPMLLDSGPVPGHLARWSLLVFDPVETIRRHAQPGRHTLRELGEALARRWPDAEPERDVTDRPGFAGGAVGWLAYDLGRELERLPARCPADADLPDLLVGLYPFALAEESATGRRLIVGRGTPAEAERFLDQVRELGLQATAIPELEPPVGPVRSTFDRPAYLSAVEAIREHIRDGDVYQVNLAQRFELVQEGPSASLHAALRRRFPAPFAALLRVPGLSVVSSSPELFLRRRGTLVVSCPIKGTRPRADDPRRDAALRAELERSPKERAELSMIVDLVRNDLGRCAEVGSVAVELPFGTDSWSTVHHRVATVRCRVDRRTPSWRLIESAFPPASVTGTPKIRACELIESLEPVRRHVYTGAIGWLGAGGDLDLSVAIRIATRVGRRLLIPVGGGITLASDPAAEYEETLHKARALFDVLRLPMPETGIPA
jgi:para-aminobenzoate synthetase component 1